MAGYSGTISANTTFHTGDTWDGNTTLADTYTFTFDAGARVSAAGNYSVTVKGKIVCDGTRDAWIELDTNQSNPTDTMWVGLIFQDIDADSSMSYTRIRYAAAAITFSTSFTDNFSTRFNKVKIEECRSALIAGLAVTFSWGSLEIIDCRAAAAGTNVIYTSGVGTWAWTRLVMRGCHGTHQHVRTDGSTPTISPTVLIVENPYIVSEPGTSYAVFASGNALMQVNIGTIWAWDLNTAIWRHGSTSAASTIGAGIMMARQYLYMSSNMGSNCQVSNCDIHGFNCGVKIDQGSAPFHEHCHITGFAARTKGYVDSASGGTKNGVAELTTGIWTGGDGAANVQATPNYARTITSVSAGTPGADYCDISHTVNFPAESIMGIATSSQSAPTTWGDFVSKYARRETGYSELVDYSGDGKLFDTLTARTMRARSLVAGTYYVRFAAWDRFLRQWIFSAEVSFTIASTADTTPPTFGGATSATDTGTSKEVLLAWSASADSDLDGYRIYYDTTNNSTNILNNGRRATAPKTATSFTVGALTNGTKYYFIVRAVDTSQNTDSNTTIVSATPTNATASNSYQAVQVEIAQRSVEVVIGR